MQLKDKHISIFRENRMKIASRLISIFRYFTTLLPASDSIRIPNLISSAIRHSFSLSLTKLNSILFTGGFALPESLPHGFNIPSSPTFTPCMMCVVANFFSVLPGIALTRYERWKVLRYFPFTSVNLMKTRKILLFLPAGAGERVKLFHLEALAAA